MFSMKIITELSSNTTLSGALLISKGNKYFPTGGSLTLLHSEWPKLHRVLAILSAIELRRIKDLHIFSTLLQKETVCVTSCLLPWTAKGYHNTVNS